MTTAFAPLPGITRHLPFAPLDVISNTITRDYDLGQTEERLIVAHSSETPGFVVAIISDEGHYSGQPMWCVHPAVDDVECPSMADAMAAVLMFGSYYEEGVL